MRRGRELPPGSIEKLKPFLMAARTVSQLRRVQCLWLRASLHLTAQQVATAIGWTPGAVRRFQARYIREGEALLQGPGRGARRHEYLTHEAEEDLLRRLRAGAGTALEVKALEVKAIHLAYEQAAGRPVPKSTVYRMLLRHGWRKSAVGTIKPPRKHSAASKEVPHSGP